MMERKGVVLMKTLKITISKRSKSLSAVNLDDPKIDSLLEQLEMELFNAKGTAEKLCKLMVGTSVSGQLKAYTIPRLDNLINDGNQPGSIKTLYRISDRR